MKILVTGMAGFIGFHCSKTLAEQGHSVLGLDNMNPYYSPKLKEARLMELKKLENAPQFMKIDISNPTEVLDIVKQFKPDAILHLAAQAGVRYSITNPQVYIDTNIQGTQNLLEAARHCGQPRFVFASSSSVYGLNTKSPFAESDPTDRPIALYGATKKANELMAHSYSHLFGIQAIGLRFFTVYGPWGRPDMALWLFTQAISKGEPIKVFNYGDMYRDFTYIDDIVQGTLACLFEKELGPFEIFNLGNHKSEHLGRMIELIEQTLDKKAEKTMLPMQDGDVQSTCADIDKAQRQLGFRPLTEIGEGVPRFIEWFNKHPEFHS